MEISIIFNEQDMKRLAHTSYGLDNNEGTGFLIGIQNSSDLLLFEKILLGLGYKINGIYDHGSFDDLDNMSICYETNVPWEL